MSILRAENFSRLADFAYPPLIRNFPGEPGKLYLTFDDGPVPGILEEVLNILSSYQSRATFFCLGKNVEENPGLLLKIMRNGHQVGNHSYSHPDGFRTGVSNYLADVAKAASLIPSNYFRPPYGRIFPWQAWRLSVKYDIVLWDAMSMDYNQSAQKDTILRNLVSATSSGSVIVMHNSEMAAANLRYVLPRYLEHFTHLGLHFDTIGRLQTGISGSSQRPPALRD
jgi:peptidoglycan-N-acetylglucosamine deacetylase